MADGAHRSWAQRLLIAVNVVLLVTVATALGFGAFLYQRVRSIPSVDIGTNPPGLTPSTAVPTPTGPENFLIVGSDTRDGQDDDAFGAVDGQRADVILLVRIDVSSGSAAMLSIPRDVVVRVRDAAGTDLGEDRINTAFAGGPAQLTATIRSELGIPVDHYLQINFEGFRDSVDAIGGVDVYLPGPVRDRDQRGRNRAGLDIDASGCVRLDGSQTLAYVRSRHFEQLIDGQWDADQTGDLGRIRRQHDLARRVASQALDRGLFSPTSIVALLDAANDNLVIDDGLSPAGLVTFGQQLSSITPARLQQLTLAVTDDVGPVGQAILRLDDTPANASILDVFRGQPAAAADGSGTPPPPVIASTTTTTALEPAC